MTRGNKRKEPLTGFDPSPVPRIKSRLHMSVGSSSNLGRDGVAVVNGFMDLDLIADLQKTTGQIPLKIFTNGTNMLIQDSPVTLLPWRPVCAAIMAEFEKKKSQISDLDTRTIKSWQFVHFHIKETSYLKRGIAPGRILISIPIQIDAGYPLFIKGSHKSPHGIDDQLCPVEVPLDIGSVVLWYGETELVYPIVGSFKRGGGFAIMLGY